MDTKTETVAPVNKGKTPKWAWNDERYARALALYQAVPESDRDTQDKNRDAMDKIADTLGVEFGFDDVRPRSVISKLSSQGDYVKPEKATTTPREQGPTNKEILVALREQGPEGFDEVADGFNGTSKAGLKYLAEQFGVSLES